MKKSYFAPTCDLMIVEDKDILTASGTQTPAQAGSFLDWDSESDGYGFY